MRGTQPQSHRLHRFKWLFRDDKSSAGGRGSARIAPPDSMRFDVAGPFGSGAASAAVIGEQPLWARAARRGEQAGAELPADVGDVRRGAASVGRGRAAGPVRRRHARLAVRGGRRHGRVRAHRGHPRPNGDARCAAAGEIVGRAETTLDSTGAPLTARLTVPSVPARLDLTFLSTAQADFAPDIWVSRKP